LLKDFNVPKTYRDPEKRKMLVELTPCVLGMDILSKFEIYIYRNRIDGPVP